MYTIGILKDYSYMEGQLSKPFWGHSKLNNVSPQGSFPNTASVQQEPVSDSLNAVSDGRTGVYEKGANQLLRCDGHRLELHLKALSKKTYLSGCWDCGYSRGQPYPATGKGMGVKFDSHLISRTSLGIGQGYFKDFITREPLPLPSSVALTPSTGVGLEGEGAGK